MLDLSFDDVYKSELVQYFFLYLPRIYGGANLYFSFKKNRNKGNDRNFLKKEKFQLSLIFQNSENCIAIVGIPAYRCIF